MVSFILSLIKTLTLAVSFNYFMSKIERLFKTAFDKVIESSITVEVAEEILNSCGKTAPSENGIVMNEICEILLKYLKSKKDQNRLNSLFLINFIFRKSGIFRELMAIKLNLIAVSVGVIKPKNGSYVPSLISSKLARDFLIYLSEWDYYYGKSVINIRSFARFLNEALKIPLPNVKVP